MLLESDKLQVTRSACCLSWCVLSRASKAGEALCNAKLPIPSFQDRTELDIFYAKQPDMLICTLTLWRTRESSAGTGNWDRTGGGTARWASLCFMRQYMAVYTLYTNTAKNTYILYHFILFVRPKYQRNLSVVVRSLVRPGRCFERATAFLLVVRCWDDLRAFMPCHAMPVGTAK